MEVGFSLFLLSGMLMCGLLFHTVSQHGAHVDEPSKKPNFIVILADDIGWGDLDVNQPDKKANNTPYLNLMAEQGLRLTDFHSPASTCSPSRAAILTGRYGLRNGVTHNFAVGSVAGLPLSEVTFPQLLQKAGYYTAMIGKWHLGHNGPYGPTKRGHSSTIECVSESIGLTAGNRLYTTKVPAAVSCEMTDSLLTFSLQLTQHSPPTTINPSATPPSLEVSHSTSPQTPSACESQYFRKLCRKIPTGFDYYFGIPYSNDMGCTDIPGYNLPQCPPCDSSGPQVIRLKRSVHGGCYSKVGLPLIENSSIVEQPLDLWTLTEQYKSAATRIIQNARERGQPYLLYIALAHMHVPLAPPLPPDASATASRPDDSKVYTASLREMDDLVGVVKSASDDTDKDNTLIWFTGDNGPWEQKCQYAGSVGPFKGKWQTSRGGGSAKRTTWEGGHRVPTVVYWPRRISANTTSSALLSGMDIFPTLLSLAGVTPPSDRRYDGIDATNIFLHGERSGHEVLFHPNSGAAGTFGDLQTVRTGKHKAFYITGAAEACGGATGRQQLHDPPLIFDLERDETEETPLEVQTPEYQAVQERITRWREELLWDIATDKSVSAADYITDKSAAPCCDPRHAVCRCHPLG